MWKMRPLSQGLESIEIAAFGESPRMLAFGSAHAFEEVSEQEAQV